MNGFLFFLVNLFKILIKFEGSDKSLDSIEHLDLSNGNVGSSELILLTRAILAHNTAMGTQSPLQTLNLSNCNICGANYEPGISDIKGFTALCRNFSTNRYLKILNLTGNVLTIGGCRVLSDLLENNVSLKELM